MQNGPRPRIGWRALLIPVLIVAIILFVASRVGDLRHMAALVRQANPWWLALACLVECLRSVSNGKLFQTTLDIVGYRFGWGQMIAKVTAFNAVNRLVPTGGASGSALMVASLQGQGVPPDRSLFAIGMTYLFDYVTYLFIVAVTFVYLAFIGHLQGQAVMAGALLTAIIAGVVLFLWWGMGKQEHLRSFLAAVIRRLRRLRPHHTYAQTPEDAAAGMVARLDHLRSDIAANRGQLRRPILPAIGYNVLDIFNVWCVFQAFGHPQPIGYVAAGFVIATLVGFITFVPGQLGTFEAAMAASFHKLFGVNLDVAILVTGAYRLIQYWIPIPVGIVLAKWALRVNPVQTAADNGV